MYKVKACLCFIQVTTRFFIASTVLFSVALGGNLTSGLCIEHIWNLTHLGVSGPTNLLFKVNPAWPGWCLLLITMEVARVTWLGQGQDAQGSL